MPVYAHGLTTAVPDPTYLQDWTCDLVQEHATTRRGIRRIIRSIYRNSGIRKRHSVIDDWADVVRDPLFFDGAGQRLATPGTGRRNDVYAREAKDLFTRLARNLVENTEGFSASDVTHVVTVSCTGFFAPGPDYHVVRALGLPGSTQRYHVGFMGCYAAFQALRMAHAFCRSDPEAVVLVLSVELCTLHLQFSEDTDELIAGAVFADGGAGALVSARDPAPGRLRPAMELETFHTALTEEGEEDMAWTIGDQGFRMRLSTYVPEIIQANLSPVLAGLLERCGVTASELDHFAVHPGGRAILDKVEATLGMAAGGLAASRHILQEFGNMSSATILFVLNTLLEGGGVRAGDRILAMAFGPGLTIESGLFRAH